MPTAPMSWCKGRQCDGFSGAHCSHGVKQEEIAISVSNFQTSKQCADHTNQNENPCMVSGGEGKKKIFDTGWDIFFSGVTPRRGRGTKKKWVPQKKLFLPMSHLAHIITVFPTHKMPLPLVGIPLFGYLGY